MSDKFIPIQAYDKPAGGFGSLRGTASALSGNGAFPALQTLPRVNQPQGIDCPGCAYPDSPTDKAVDFCEQGAWAISHEATPKRATPEHFAKHTVTELRRSEEWQLEPVRGHSNVQGDRTVGITNRPRAEWLQGLERVFGFAPPSEPGLDAVATINGLLDGSVHAFTGLGGNFAVAGPDSPRVLDALSRCKLTVHIATKLNRTHLYPGETGLLLPCLGRTEHDQQAGGQQFVSVEDTASMVHASTGRNRPASDKLRSEPFIVTELARHALPDSNIDWTVMGRDYDATRDLIERVAQGAVAGFERYNANIRRKRGFHLPNTAALRVWKTDSGKANFAPHALPQDTIMKRARAVHGERVVCLATVRAHRQYNTTVYFDPKGEVDRYRGVHHTRKVLFVGPATLARLGFKDGDTANLRAASLDGIERVLEGYRLVEYPILGDDVFGYFPELTPLSSPDLTARGSNTPAFKEVPILIEKA